MIAASHRLRPHPPRMSPGRLVALAILAGLSASPIDAQVRALVGTTFDARVVSITDGDTVDVRPAGQTRPLRIRLEGIDAPERGEPFSDRARTFARVLLFDQPVRVEGRDVDRYGRLVARIRVGGKDASEELVGAGIACHYTVFASDPALARREADARAQGRGFWAAGAAKPQCVTGSRPPSPPANVRSGAPGAFHGNISSRVYHSPSCRNYTCKNCTRVFASESEAKAAGFRPAGDCLRR